MTDQCTGDGGPAFPCLHDGSTRTDAAGMSLLDYFAAKAMQSLIIDPERDDQSCEECARLAYRMADAMLRARKAAP